MENEASPNPFTVETHRTHENRVDINNTAELTLLINDIVELSIISATHARRSYIIKRDIILSLKMIGI